jgi:hypothetical protein
MLYTADNVRITRDFVIFTARDEPDFIVRLSFIEAITVRHYPAEHVWELRIRMNSGRKYVLPFSNITGVVPMILAAAGAAA